MRNTLWKLQGKYYSLEEAYEYVLEKILKSLWFVLWHIFSVLTRVYGRVVKALWLFNSIRWKHTLAYLHILKAKVDYFSSCQRDWMWNLAIKFLEELKASVMVKEYVVVVAAVDVWKCCQIIKYGFCIIFHAYTTTRANKSVANTCMFTG